MTGWISVAEHLERVRRVQTVPCPKCGAVKGRPCVSPFGAKTPQQHAARYAALYRRAGTR